MRSSSQSYQIDNQTNNITIDKSTKPKINSSNKNGNRSSKQNNQPCPSIQNNNQSRSSIQNNNQPRSSIDDIVIEIESPKHHQPLNSFSFLNDMVVSNTKKNNHLHSSNQPKIKNIKDYMYSKSNKKTNGNSNIDDDSDDQHSNQKQSLEQYLNYQNYNKLNHFQQNLVNQYIDKKSVNYLAMYMNQQDQIVITFTDNSIFQLRTNKLLELRTKQFELTDEIKQNIVIRYDRASNSIHFMIEKTIDSVDVDKDLELIFKYHHSRNLRVKEQMVAKFEKSQSKFEMFLQYNQQEQAGLYAIEVNQKVLGIKRNRKHNNEVQQGEGQVDSSYCKQYMGLRNEGHICYLNSFLQTLFHLSAFSKQVINYKLDCEESHQDEQTRIIEQIQRLFSRLIFWNQENNNIENNVPSPLDLCKAFGWGDTQIFEQRDIQEFKLELLNGLEQKIPQIQKIFHLQSIHRYKCVNVEYSSESKEEEYELFLPIKSFNDIYESFKHQQKKELLNGANKYQTEQFGKQDAYKSTYFDKLSEVLLIRLGVFEYTNNQNCKVFEEFKYYDKINLNGQEYELYSVMVHKGNSASSGHYISYIKKTIKNSRKWYSFDDEKVQIVNRKQVFNFHLNMFKVGYNSQLKKVQVQQKQNESTPYLLMYIKQQLFNEYVRDLEIEDIPRTIMDELWGEQQRIKRANMKKEMIRVYLTDMKMIQNSGHDFKGSVLFWPQSNNDQDVSIRVLKDRGLVSKVRLNKGYSVEKVFSSILGTENMVESQFIVLHLKFKEFSSGQELESIQVVRDEDLQKNFRQYYIRNQMTNNIKGYGVIMILDITRQNQILVGKELQQQNHGIYHSKKCQYLVNQQLQRSTDQQVFKLKQSVVDDFKWLVFIKYFQNQQTLLHDFEIVDPVDQVNVVVKQFEQKQQVKVYWVYLEEQNFDQKEVSRTDIIEKVAKNYSIILFDLNQSQTDNLKCYYQKVINRAQIEIMYNGQQLDTNDNSLEYDQSILTYFQDNQPTVKQIIDYTFQQKIFNRLGIDRNKIIVKYMNRRKNLAYAYEYDKNKDLESISALDLMANEQKLYVSYSNVEFKDLKDNVVVGLEYQTRNGVCSDNQQVMISNQAQVTEFIGLVEKLKFFESLIRYEKQNVQGTLRLMIYDPIQQHKLVNIVVADIRLSIVRQKYTKMKLFLCQNITSYTQKQTCVNFVDRNNEYFGNPFVMVLDISHSIDQIYQNIHHKLAGYNISCQDRQVDYVPDETDFLLKIYKKTQLIEINDQQKFADAVQSSPNDFKIEIRFNKLDLNEDNNKLRNT